MNFTPQQQQAIAARGNVLVMAGAGTGKTRTLVERCLNLLQTESPPVSLDEILLVTFTEAAAAEMRQRIRLRLEEELSRAAENARWQEQLALLDTAHIGTLHGFCLQLIRRHFHELELDPQLTVLPEAEAHLLASETLDAILKNHYAGDDALAEAVQGLIQSQGRGWDKPVRALVFKIHHYAQTLPDPNAWFTAQLKMFNSQEPEQWRQWLVEALLDWAKSSLAFLQPLAGANELAAKAAESLSMFEHETGGNVSPAGLAEKFADMFEYLAEIPGACPPRKKTALLKPLENFFADVSFLASLVRSSDGKDPLAEDWNWVRGNMLALLRLAGEFSRDFAEAKRELGTLDFHDLEQHALRLLWDSTANEPTAVARQWRRRLRFVFVDEYQDINAAQDQIIQALGGDGAASNRFLVGDVKQSIYRFRLANPRVFQHYAATWRDAANRTIPLTENFRSREGVLGFVNSLFELVMRHETGTVVYDNDAKLKFGAPEDRRVLGLTENAEPRVELHLCLSGGKEGVFEESENTIAELSEAGREARLVALRLRELRSQQHKIWDERTRQFRAVEWRDMTVLLRSPSARAEVYAKEFSALGVPLVVARGGFFGSLEILDLLNLLQLLDNPLQDVPALAVLRSPIVGLSLDELAAVRLAATKAPFWTAVIRGQKSELDGQKLEDFLVRFPRWRTLARRASLSRCLETVLAETHYVEWLLTQPRGSQRSANVARLLQLARQFDQFQRQGLFRFLRFVEAQQEAELEPEVAGGAEQNAVRLLSIHQSKGLEFPVVVVADLARCFNETDLRADIILDEIYGLCPQIKPPQTGARYPSLAHWLARRRQKLEMLGEELRLLYVATTRARDTLILSASISEKEFETRWRKAEDAVAPQPAPRCFADWIAAWFAKTCSATGTGETCGAAEFLRWQIHKDAELSAPQPMMDGATVDSEEFTADEETWRQLETRLAWQYSYTAATQKAAKASVTSLRREATADESTGEAVDLLNPKPAIRKFRPRRATGSLSASETGAAHHRFLQFVALEKTGTAAGLREEAGRLEQDGVLSAAETSALDFDSLVEFWRGELGRKICAQPEKIRRELEFTARFSAKEIAEILGQPVSPGLENEFVVVQGMADLAVILQNEIWLVDFKTDDLKPDGLAEKVKTYEPQLQLYARALERIYRKPVTDCRLYFLSLRQAVPVQTGCPRR